MNLYLCVFSFIEKLPGSRDSPQTISEYSVSQDDSGNVSGGSRGATPEHKRTDSSFSQSSLPSSLSTVTDVSFLISNVVFLYFSYQCHDNIESCT